MSVSGLRVMLWGALPAGRAGVVDQDQAAPYGHLRGAHLPSRSHSSTLATCRSLPLRPTLCNAPVHSTVMCNAPVRRQHHDVHHCVHSIMMFIIVCAGSMLVNHVDRQDTHLASAVLQVSQEVWLGCSP